jgi:2-haloacid dehalogenase
MTTAHAGLAVVFDLGNVLIHWDPQPAIACGVGADEATRFLTADDFDFGTWNHQLDSGRPVADAEAEVARQFPHWYPHVVAYREHFEHSLLGVIDGSVDVLEDLHRAQTPLYALTNWPEHLFPAARERFSFLALFDDIVVSGEERLAKPDPEIFRVLQARVGRPLHECVFVDDKADNVDAARQAGMDAILFTDAAGLRHRLEALGLL